MLGGPREPDASGWFFTTSYFLVGVQAPSQNVEDRVQSGGSHVGLPSCREQEPLRNRRPNAEQRVPLHG